MKVYELVEIVEKLAPLSLALPKDNPGLQIGRRDAEVKKVYLTVDVTHESIAAAAAAGCDFILSHHPMIYHDPLMMVNDSGLQSSKALEIIEHGMAYYATHTPFDCAKGGMGDAAAELIGIKDTAPMMPDQKSPEEGIGRVGTLDEPMTAQELTDKVKSIFDLPGVILYDGSPAGKKLSRVATLPGGGNSAWELALMLKADAYITGDITYHNAMDAVEKGLTIIDAGHYGIEWIFVPTMSRYLAEKAPELEIVCAPVHHVAQFR